MRQVGIFLVLGALVGCSKAEPAGSPPVPGVEPAASAPASSSGSSAEGESSLEPASSPAAAAPGAAALREGEAAVPSSREMAAPSEGQVAAPAGGPPASFKGGRKEEIASAVGLGCEPTSLDGWLQLLCRKKNGSGGHPTRALIRTPGAEGDAAAAQAGREPSADEPAGRAVGDEVLPNEHGELTVVVPYRADEKREVTLEWSDTRYTLHVDGAQASLEWAAAGVPHRRACAAVANESKAELTNAQKLEGAAKLTTTETGKLPRFGVCQQAGLGSWALGLKSAVAVGEGASRAHRLELEVIRVDVSGARKSAPFGTLEVAPGGFTLGALQAYDYDDDGNDELIVPFELKALAAGGAPELPPAIWSFNDAGIAPYPKAPALSGGVAVDHLDFDMRPDLGSYAGFVAYLGADCGLKACPPRISGPKLFFHALPDGGFANADEAVRTALKRACPSKPATVVAESGASVNAELTAKNLVCARAHGVPLAALAGELTAKHAALCGAAESCPLSSALEAWLKLPLPLELGAPALAKK